MLVLTAFFLRRGATRRAATSQTPLIVALALSVLLFAGSKLAMDDLPLVLQPYLVRAAIVISLTFAGLAVHTWRQPGGDVGAKGSERHAMLPQGDSAGSDAGETDDGGSAPIGLVVSSGGEVNALAALLAVSYLAIQVALW
eukprot:COSAG04_NODE_776_length_10398_cov_2.756870_11_plen_141_part_00